MKFNKVIIVLLIVICIILAFLYINSLKDNAEQNKNEKRLIISVICVNKVGNFESAVNEIFTFNVDGKCSNCRVIKTIEDKEILEQMAVEIASDSITHNFSNPVLQENSISYNSNQYNGLEEYEIRNEYESKYINNIDTINNEYKFFYYCYEL